MQESDDQRLSAADHPHANKKRKMRERVVVAVKIEGNVKKQQRNEGPPSDPWSWRKYGQKPIKGSPYPRGYYRCSTSKGCSAKKQVERCRTDSSMLIITYTSSHNHPLSPPSTNSRLTESRRPKIPSQEQESSAEIETPPPSNPFEEIHQTPEAQALKMEEENDFYDELEELPTSSFFTAFMKTSLCCKERIAPL